MSSDEDLNSARIFTEVDVKNASEPGKFKTSKIYNKYAIAYTVHLQKANIWGFWYSKIVK